MAYKIIWTDTAELSYIQILEFIKHKWSNKEVLNFSEKTAKILNLVSKTPQMFPSAKKQNIRKCLLTSQTSLFYQIIGKDIYLIMFWDNRQNPKKLKL